MTCDKATYVASNRTEDGVWEFAAMCDGPPLCGFDIPIPEGDVAEVVADRLCWFGITSEEMAEWDRLHREFTR